MNFTKCTICGIDEEPEYMLEGGNICTECAGWSYHVEPEQIDFNHCHATSHVVSEIRSEASEYTKRIN